MTASTSPEETPDKAKPKPTLLLPLVLVALLLGLLFIALRTGEHENLPSALIGKPVPDFALPPIANVLGNNGPTPGLSSAAFKTGKVSVLNVWASWCAPCLAEYPQLIELSEKGIPLYSINYKDKPEAARRILGYPRQSFPRHRSGRERLHRNRFRGVRRAGDFRDRRRWQGRLPLSWATERANSGGKDHAW